MSRKTATVGKLSIMFKRVIILLAGSRPCVMPKTLGEENLEAAVW